MFSKNNNLIFYEFNKEKFNFNELISKHLKDSIKCDRIEEFHKFIPKEKMPKDIYEGTAHTYGHDILYAIDKNFKQANIVKVSDLNFINLYREFIDFLSKEIFQKDIIFQKKPSLRIHYPNFTSYGKFHRDSDYNHPKEEINIWLPITKVQNTASMQIESEIGKEDFKPVNLEYGKFLIFNSELLHGNVVNKEGYTRFSMDFRIMFKSNYKKFKKSSATQKIKFELGEYYDTL